MSKIVMNYFKSDDVIYLTISKGKQAGSVEVSPNITAEVDANGEIIGLEILQASKFLRDAVLDSAQARLLSGTSKSKRQIPSPRTRKYSRQIR